MNLEQVIIRPARAGEVERMVEIEACCFPAAEAASLKSFQKRYETFPECFFVAELPDGTVVGHINGCVTDTPKLPDELYHDVSLHKKEGDWQTVFGLAVLPKYQRRGIAGAILEYLIQTAKERGRKGVLLTCKDHLIPFYSSHGFVFQGVSASTHGDAKWNDMLLEF